jgi:hypothetical protein
MHIEEIKLIKTIKKDKEYNWFDAEAELEKEYDQKNLNNVLDALKGNFEKNKIAYIWGSFSGGHDEGGFDDAGYYDKNDKEITPTDLSTHWVNRYKLFKSYDKEQINYYVQEYHKKIDLLEPNSDYNAMSLLYSTGALNEYGSFAGEYRVDGEVKLDVINKKYYRTGNQTVEQWESIDEEGMVA